MTASEDRLPFLRFSGEPPARWGALALGLGLFGDLLLRPGPSGLNATLWAAALVAVGLHLRAGHGRPGSDLALAGMALAAAAVFTLRAAPALHV
ncbi:MAG TPA: hypothetical protein VML54_14395, partial [Candidatus Limnocylindrales bacterium]|nr:hypothetical protein [Candidatus Limnocylindrales bacterium]